MGMSEVTGTTDASVVREVKDLYGVASSILGYDLLDLCLHGPTETINSTVDQCFSLVYYVCRYALLC